MELSGRGERKECSSTCNEIIFGVVQPHETCRQRRLLFTEASNVVCEEERPFSADGPRVKYVGLHICGRQSKSKVERQLATDWGHVDDDYNVAAAAPLAHGRNNMQIGILLNYFNMLPIWNWTVNRAQFYVPTPCSHRYVWKLKKIVLMDYKI